MADKKKLGFSRKDFTFPRIGSQPASADSSGKIPVETIKSSYIISADLHKRVKLLSIEQGVGMGDLFAEALDDLLRKYGR